MFYSYFRAEQKQPSRPLPKKIFPWIFDFAARGGQLVQSLSSYHTKVPSFTLLLFFRSSSTSQERLILYHSIQETPIREFIEEFFRLEE